MNKKLIGLMILFGLIFYYIIAYMCIYTTFITYNVLYSFEPEYRSKLAIGTEYRHFYININEHDIFLSPFREYSESYKIYESNNNYISRIHNWGYLYVPLLDIFVNQNGVLE